MKKTLFLASLLSASLALHTVSHQIPQQQPLNHQNGATNHRKLRHKYVCQFCQDCQPVIGGSYQCNKCSYGNKVDGKCPNNSKIPNCYSEQQGKCWWCRSGFFLDKQGSCKACSSKGCSSCSQDGSECYFCDQGLYLTQQGNCQVCPSKCLSCQKDKCFGCAYGFTMDQTEKCVKCEVENCLGCYSVGECSYCLSGYGFKGQKCTKCPDNCSFCQNGLCQYCKTGYFMVLGDNKCTKCNIENCIDCMETSGGQSCNFCNYNFSVSKDHSKCVECQVPGCQFCDAPNHCASCYWGKKISTDGKNCQDAQDEQNMQHKKQQIAKHHRSNQPRHNRQRQ